jgi:hypothetical protein
MELQMCNIFEENDTLCNKQYNFIIIILIVIYSIFISVITSIIIFIKQPVENKDEELLLANYNTKDRALALQAAYKEQLQVLFEKRMNILKNLSTFKPLSVNELPSGWTLITLFGGYTNNYNHLLTVNNLLLSKISEKVSESMSKDIETIDEEILIVAKKAGFFEANSDLWNDLHKCIEPTNQFYNDYNLKFVNLKN